MSDNINSMNYKQLRNEVQLLRDELAIMKRNFEDILYNLDTDNFSQRVVKQGKDMYTKIEQTAGEISLQAEKITDTEKNIAELSVTATTIRAEVQKVEEDANKKFENYSTTEQTAEAIRAEVTSINTAIDEKVETLSTQIEQTKNEINLSVEEYVTNALDNSGYVTNAELQLTANGITSTVEALSGDVDGLSSYIDGLDGDISGLRSDISSIEQTAKQIQTTVGSAVLGKYIDGQYTIYTQTNDTFHFDGEYMRIKSAVQLTDNSGNHAFSIFHDESSNSPNGGIVYLWGVGDYSYVPVVIGSSNSSGTQPIYLYDDSEDNLVATQGWVLENAGSNGVGGVAVFG